MTNSTIHPELLRTMRLLQSAQNAHVVLDGKDVLNFSSNNYLGLANHPKIVTAVQQALSEFGFGSGASRLIVGNHTLHKQLENELAAFHNAEDCLLFATGYQANVGCLQAVGTQDRTIFSDELNHASIVDGCRLAKAKVAVYRHCDVSHLESLLQNCENAIVVTDTVFSMDGNLAPIKQLRSVCDKYNAILVVDEAHAGGVIGKEGQGVCHQQDVHPDIHVGTLSKAFGGFGGYAAGTRQTIQLLKHRARSFIYTTASPPAIAAGNLCALHMIAGTQGATLRNKLSSNIEYMASYLTALGIYASTDSPIFPIMIGDNHSTMDLSKKLLSHGVFLQGIRPPTVPVGTARLRCTITADHTQQDIRQLIAVLKQFHIQ